MGFQLPNNQPSNVVNTPFKKADAFINMYLPRRDGTRMQMETVKLYVDKAEHAKLIEMFNEEPEKTTQLIREKLIVDFRLAQSDSADLDL